MREHVTYNEPALSGPADEIDRQPDQTGERRRKRASRFSRPSPTIEKRGLSGKLTHLLLRVHPLQYLLSGVEHFS
jgi:hypothetical protein